MNRPLFNAESGAFSPDGESVFSFGMAKGIAPIDPRTGRPRSSFECPAFGNQLLRVVLEWKDNRLSGLWFFIDEPPHDRLLTKRRHDSTLIKELGEASRQSRLGGSRFNRWLTRVMSGVPNEVFEPLPAELLWKYPWGEVVSGYEVRDLSAIIRVVWRKIR